MKTKEEIIRRAVCLLCFADRCSLEKTVIDGVKRTLDEREAQRNNIIRWLNVKGYYGYLTQKEMDVFNSPVTEKMNKDYLLMYNDFECIEPLLWSLGLVDKLSNYDDVVLDNLHYPLEIGPKHSLEELVNHCREIPIEVVERQREIAMLWRWRSIETRSKLNDAVDYFDVIKNIFGDEYGNLLKDYDYFDQNKGDFIVGGNLVSELDEMSVSKLEVISERRFYAFEWMCSEDDWDDVNLVS